jgi:type II secretory pathway pseudopilin PulG
MKHRKKIIRSLKTKNEAVAGIVVAVMIVGLVLAIVSIIQTIYIPKWMESREAEHMGVVSDQFSQLKYAIDSQIVSQKNTPISTPITLGSRELGFFISNKAFGRLAIISNGWAYRITRTVGDTFEGNFGVLRYNSENSYFLNQAYTYEIGGVILDQDQGYVFIIKPEVSARYNTSNRQVDLSMRCIDLISNDDRTSITGYGTYPVRTEYIASTNDTITSVKSLTVITPFPAIWENFLNATLSKVYLEKNNHYMITKSSNQVTVSFNYPPLTNVILNLETAIVSTQITMGWSD